jgi:hypothetical protein
MTPAIFGITNGPLNTIANLLVLSLVAIWIALIYSAFRDAQRRYDDPFYAKFMWMWAFFPFVGSIIYSIVRPPEFLEDVREREIETKAAETRLTLLTTNTCRHCGYQIEPSYLRCPSCLRKLKEPCESCGKPLDPRWRVCPFCETEVQRAIQAQAQERARRRPGARQVAPPASRPAPPASRPAPASVSASERQQRSLAAARTAAGPEAPTELARASSDNSAQTSEQVPRRMSAAAAIGPQRSAVASRPRKSPSSDVPSPSGDAGTDGKATSAPASEASSGEKTAKPRTKQRSARTKKTRAKSSPN